MDALTSPPVPSPLDSLQPPSFLLQRPDTSPPRMRKNREGEERKEPPPPTDPSFVQLPVCAFVLLCFSSHLYPSGLDIPASSETLAPILLRLYLNLPFPKTNHASSSCQRRLGFRSAPRDTANAALLRISANTAHSRVRLTRIFFFPDSIGHVCLPSAITCMKPRVSVETLANFSSASRVRGCIAGAITHASPARDTGTILLTCIKRWRTSGCGNSVD